MSTKHTAGSNECLKHYKENVALNKFIIEFMVGEGIAQSPCAVLGVRQAEGLTGNDYSSMRMKLQTITNK